MFTPEHFVVRAEAIINKIWGSDADGRQIHTFQYFLLLRIVFEFFHLKRFTVTFFGPLPSSHWQCSILFGLSVTSNFSNISSVVSSRLLLLKVSEIPQNSRRSCLTLMPALPFQFYYLFLQFCVDILRDCWLWRNFLKVVTELSQVFVGISQSVTELISIL